MKSNLRYLVISCTLLTLGSLAHAARGITVTGVSPDKLVYGFEAPMTITVTVSNTTKDAVTAQLKVVLASRLTWEETLYDQPVPLAAGETKPVPVSYRTGKKSAGAEYGYEARATLTTPGQPVSTLREFFMVTDNPVKIGHMSIPAGMVDHREGLGGLQSGIERARASYVSVFETAFWAPCDFSELTTTRESWTSGQAGRYNSLPGMKAMASAVHSFGGRIVIYADKWACGAVGFENARRHPEWYHWGQDWYGCKFDVETLDWIAEPTYQDGKWKPHQEGGIWAICPLIAKPEVAQFGIDQITGSMQQFDWDGIRLDNNGWYVDDRTDIEGKPAVKPGADVPKLEAQLVRQIKAAGRKVKPYFIYGDNVGWCTDISKASPKWLAEAADGGLLMDEGMRSTTHPGSSLNRWDYLREYLRTAIPTVRKAGGYPYGIIFPANENDPQPVRADGAILYAVLMGSGMHIFGVAPPNFHPYMRLYARYCDLLYADNLQFVAAPEALLAVTSPAPIWWKDYVRRRELPNGTTQFIVHLINPSTGERIATGEGFNGTTNPAPEIRKDLRVALTPPAGLTVRRAFRLTADGHPGPDALALPVTMEGGKAVVTVPELTYWDIIVFEGDTSAKGASR